MNYEHLVQQKKGEISEMLVFGTIVFSEVATVCISIVHSL